MKTGMGLRPTFRYLLLLLLLGLVVAACAKSGNEDTTATTATTAATDTTVAVQANVEPFCNAVIQTKILASAGPQVDFENATEDEIGAAFGDYFGQLEPLLTEFEATAPDEMTDSVDTISAVLRESIETGEEPKSDTPEFFDADADLVQYVLANCDVERMSVTAIDYEFQGVPTTMKAGTAALEFKNEGTEIHEMVVFRINDGVTESIGELLDLPQEEAEQKIQYVGSAFAEPGSSDVGFAELSPGNYGVVCFIPVGATDMETVESGQLDDAPPHFMEGMVAEFTVEG